MTHVRRDVDIYYADYGDSDTTLLFCHGAGGNAASWWQQLGAFSGRYRCLAFDHRGFGRSRCAPEAFDLTRFPGDALAVMDAAGVERAHVICQSMGGWTGLRLALDHPQRVVSLVLSDTIGGLALASGIDSARTMGQRAAAAGAVSPALAADYHLLDPAGACLYQELGTFNADPEELDLFSKLFAAEVLISTERLAALTLPVMVVAGSKDLIWPPAVLEELAGLIPGARFEVVEAGHSPYFENAGAFNSLLEDFLGSVTAR